MADPSTDEPTPTPETAADDTASDAAPANAESVASPATDAAPAAESPANPEPPPPKPLDIPDALKDCVERVRATLQDEVDDRELVRTLKKHVRELKKWPEWSEHARHAYAHLIAAEIMHQKAAAICIEHGVDFNPTERAEYDHLLRTMQHRNPR